MLRRIGPLLLASAAVRMVFLCYGLYQDAVSTLKYTDIDYWVFTDAARYISNGESPYNRKTYRYTPLLAYLMLPNIYVAEFVGKILFTLADLMVGWIIYRILLQVGRPGTPLENSTRRPVIRRTKRKADEVEIISTALIYSSIWLLNPFVITISTRGNAESFLCAMVMSVVYFMQTGWYKCAAVIYGLSVHFKIYPVIYAIPLALNFTPPAGRLLFDAINRKSIQFALISFLSFAATTALMFRLFGYEFLEEAYFYHIGRRDHRHNFSVYFYNTYLTLNKPIPAAFGTLLAFVPQLLLSISVGLVYRRDLPFAMFLQTFIFVAFNKVLTSQYFMWFLCFLPIVLKKSRLVNEPGNYYRGIAMLFSWFLTQALWLSFAYRLEMLGQNTFIELWFSGLLFLICNIWLAAEFIRNNQI